MDSWSCWAKTVGCTRATSIPIGNNVLKVRVVIMMRLCRGSKRLVNTHRPVQTDKRILGVLQVETRTEGRDQMRGGRMDLYCWVNSAVRFGGDSYCFTFAVSLNNLSILIVAGALT
jgi:hypothetical protein